MSQAARRLAAQFWLLAAALLAFVLWRFPPAAWGFYLQCPVFYWLHLYCPGCGATRALAALLHGRLNEALRLNAVTVAFLPPACAFFGLSYWRAIQTRAFHWPALSPRATMLSLMVVALFTIVRNL